MDLFEAALALDPESDERWELVERLRERNDEATFRAASALCAHADPARRRLGVDVLAQLGATENERPFRDATVDLLLSMAEAETEPAVLAATGYALGHLDDSRGIGTLCGLAVHEHEDVRFAAAFGLGFETDQRAIDALVALTADEDCDVRDWATFGLGENGVDSEQIREALAARLEDTDEDTRDEAMVGLAKRGDARAVEPLLAQLDDYEGSLIDESLLHLAVATGDQRLRPAVEEWLASPEDHAAPAFDAPTLEQAAAALGIVPRSG